MGNRTAMFSQKRYFVCIEVNPVRCDQAGTKQAQPAQAFNGAHAKALPTVFDFLSGFMEMQVDWEIALFGKSQSLGEVPVADGVGRVWRDAETEQRVVEKLVARRQSFGQIVIGIGGIRGRKIDGDEPDSGPHSRCQSRFGGGFRVKVHVVE